MGGLLAVDPWVSIDFDVDGGEVPSATRALAFLLTQAKEMAVANMTAVTDPFINIFLYSSRTRWELKSQSQ
ncbi:hypothetical protein ACILPN_15520 [Yersinia wautersii]|uniref:hypothetical protein n=1 Tax=Yersinia pseudotuberculosis TaxID=633 RepID=UPI0015E66FD2|nr:hypothetical protein [Yersinia pseudotuberculosis]